jgi:hypothetical protein
MNLFWVDANGLVLGTVAMLDFREYGGGLLLDSNGFLWILDTDTARVSPINILGRFYSGSGCAGTGYVAVSVSPGNSYVRPRWVSGVLGASGFFARADQQQPETVFPASFFDGAVCTTWTSGSIHAIRFDQMRSVPLLTITPVGPVHVEQQ